MGLAYEHYLKEVVTTLEKDEDFKKKLESANTSDIVVGSTDLTHYIADIPGTCFSCCTILSITMFIVILFSLSWCLHADT